MDINQTIPDCVASTLHVGYFPETNEKSMAPQMEMYRRGYGGGKKFAGGPSAPPAIATIPFPDDAPFVATFPLLVKYFCLFFKKKRIYLQSSRGPSGNQMGTKIEEIFVNLRNYEECRQAIARQT